MTKKSILISLFCIIFFETHHAFAKAKYNYGSIESLYKFHRLHALDHTAIDELQDYERCLEKSGWITDNIEKCIQDEFDKQDSLLNKEYQILFHRLNFNDKNLLRNVQRHWNRDISKACYKSYDYAGEGSLANVSFHDCILVLTTKRRLELKNYSKDLEKESIK